ncbi:MepB family protein [Streptomyces nondiastaticus]|uniref:MepB family protein n=1 Tax=Streptomyces nondiastaticus TaxID=3154512 RepID=UPI003F4E1431
MPEAESAKYAAHECTLDGLSIRFRVAKTTPTKVGQFVFPIDALRRHGVASVDGSGGKRAFRVYPPWVTTTNRQAGRSDGWTSAPSRLVRAWRLIKRSIHCPLPGCASAMERQADLLSCSCRCDHGCGAACRLPGGICRPTDLWAAPAEGRDLISPAPPAGRFDPARLWDPDPEPAGGQAGRRAGGQAGRRAGGVNAW